MITKILFIYKDENSFLKVFHIRKRKLIKKKKKTKKRKQKRNDYYFATHIKGFFRRHKQQEFQS